MLTGMGAAGLMLAAALDAQAQGASSSETVYELRIYHLNEGVMPLIIERFRKEVPVFERSGMHGVGYWVATEGPLQDRAIIYMLRHPSREVAKQNWAKFMADPEFHAAKAESESKGLKVEKAESTFMKLTEFSPRV
jgi:hypothetical protein